MTKLEQLYSSIETFKKLGVQIDEKTIESTLNIEEHIIKREVIPAMSDAIIPIISQIQRELILIIEYSPDKPVELKMTRKRSFKLTEEEESVITKRKEYKKEVKYTLTPHKKSPKTNLRVLFPDGNIIYNVTAKETFSKTIELIGIEKVSRLNIRQVSTNIVSKTSHPNYRQQKSLYGYYILTHSSTYQKKKHLEEISKKLNLGLIIEIL